MTHTSLAAAGIFASGTDLAFATIGFLAALALVIGTVSAIRTHAKEGAGSGITAQIGTIVFSVLTVAAVWLLAKLPATRPTLTTRARWLCADIRPPVSCSHGRPR